MAPWKGVESGPDDIIFVISSAREMRRCGLHDPFSATWTVVFEETKGRSDALKLTQTSTHTLLRDRRRMHPATYLSTRVFRYDHFLFSSELNLDIQHYITPPTAGANHVYHSESTMYAFCSPFKLTHPHTDQSRMKTRALPQELKVRYRGCVFELCDNSKCDPL